MRWFWSQAYRPGDLALPVVSKSLSLQEPRMSHPTNGANNAKAVGRIKRDEVISARRVAHPNRSSGHCLSTTTSASVDPCKAAAPILQIPGSWRLDVREGGVFPLSHSSPGWGWEANAGTWVPELGSFQYSRLCLQWALDGYRQTGWRVSFHCTDRAGATMCVLETSGSFLCPTLGSSYTDFQSSSRP